MTSLQCPHCGNPIPDSAKKSSGNVQCPSCGQWSALRPFRPSPSEPPVRPPVPGVLRAGVFLWIIGYVLSIVVEALYFQSGERLPATLGPEPEFNGLALSIGLFFILIVLILFAADILATISAFYGYRWGAIVKVIIFVLSLPLDLITMGLLTPRGPSYFYWHWVIFLIGITELICFISPPAMTYYKESARYRNVKAFLESPH